MLLRRNIPAGPETAQLVAAAVQAALQAGPPPGGPAGARAFPPPAASRCPDLAAEPEPLAGVFNGSAYLLTPNVGRC